MLRIVLRDIPHFVLLVLNFGLHRIFSLIFSLLTHQLSFSLYPFSLIHVQGLKSLTSLTELDLSDNNISALPPELVRFRKSLYHPFLFILFGCVWVTLCSLFLGSLFFFIFFFTRVCLNQGSRLRLDGNPLRSYAAFWKSLLYFFKLIFLIHYINFMVLLSIERNNAYKTTIADL